jgi:hypothetical protein
MVLKLKLYLGDRQSTITTELRDTKYCDICMYLGNYMYLKLELLLRKNSIHYKT